MARGRGYGGYRLRAVLIFLFFGSYVAVALLGDWYARHGEYFPVFSWDLFSTTGNLASGLELMVHRIGEREFDPAVPYTSLRGEFRYANSSNAAKALNMYLRAMKGPPERAEKMRRVIEAQVFDGKPDVEYEIERVTFVPIERWHDGSILSRRSLRRETTRRKP